MISFKRNTGRFIASAMITALFTVNVLPLVQPVYALGSMAAEDTASFTLSEDGDNITLTLNGTLTSNSWYHKSLQLDVSYDDGTSTPIIVVIKANESKGSLTFNWQDIGAVGTVTETDDDTGAYKAVFTFNKSVFGGRKAKISYQGKVLNEDSEQKPVETKTQLTSNTAGKITIDGKDGDWKNVPSLNSADEKVKEWKAALDTDGNLYVTFNGTASSEWYGDYQWELLKISQVGSKPSISTQINGISNKKYSNEAHGNTSAPYYVEFMIPAAQLNSTSFEISFAGTKVSGKNLPVLDGTDVSEEKDDTYNGIVIDGKFDDWNAVKKYDAECPNSSHPDCLESASMVFDGDYVYLYIKDGASGDASGAGSHSNGNWMIETDLGKHLVLHLNQDGSVNCKSGAVDANHTGSQWEIAVPASYLPLYRNTLNFGLYSVDDSDPVPFVNNVANLNGAGGTAGSVDMPVIDGQYGEWENYPSGYYEYTTAGTHELVIDSETSITRSTDGRTIYQYVETEDPAHLSEAGGEFSSDVTFRFNDDKGKDFYPRLIQVDEASGDINWNPTLSGLSPGTYVFSIASSDAWHTSTNINNLNDMDQIYGRMIMTIGENSKDRCELELYVDKIARKNSLNENDMKKIDSYFGKLGPQCISTSGASTGPFIGVGLSMAVVGGVWFLNRKKHSVSESR